MGLPYVPTLGWFGVSNVGIYSSRMERLGLFPPRVVCCPTCRVFLRRECQSPCRWKHDLDVFGTMAAMAWVQWLGIFCVLDQSFLILAVDISTYNIIQSHTITYDIIYDTYIVLQLIIRATQCT